LPRRWLFFRLGLGIAAFILIVLIARNLPVGQTVALQLAPAWGVLQAPVRWYQGVKLWFDDRATLLRDYRELQTQQELRAALIQDMQAVREENRQLRRLLQVQDIPGYRWQAVKVLARSPDKRSQRLLIQAINSYPDDPVVSSEGLVGLVDKVDKDHAVVRTLLDAALAVPVTLRDSASPLAALTRGQGDSLQVDFVPIAQAPPVGSVLYTSGSGGVFPAGIAVARITAIQPVEGNVFADVSAEPVAHWRRDAWLAVASSAPTP